MRPFRGAGAVTAVAGATATLVVHMTSPSSAAGSEQQPLRTVAEHARTRSVLLSGPQAQRQAACDRKWSVPPGNGCLTAAPGWPYGSGWTPIGACVAFGPTVAGY